MSKILMKSGKIWNGECFSYGDVLVNNGIIEKIAACIDENADFTFDASGKIVSCGLVDMHVHFKGVSSDAFGINAEMCTLPFGVTAAADASGVSGDETALKRLGVKNKVFVCAEFKDNRAQFDNTQKMMERYGKKCGGIKVYYDTAQADISGAEPLQEVVRFAENNNLPVMVHSSNSPITMPELLNILRGGDILTHAYHGGKNNVSDDGYECIRSAKKRGVIIDAGFAGHIHTDFNIFETAIKRGAVPDVISTDITRASAYKRGGRYGMTMCMSMARSAGMCEEDIFRCVTAAPARALGMKDEWGVLKEGGCADICVLEYADEGFDLTDPRGNRIMSENGYRCILTIADGEVVYRR